MANLTDERALSQIQDSVCNRYGQASSPVSPDDRIAISKNFRAGVWPLNGLRHPAHGNLCGWYLWAGKEFSTDPDWFDVIHFAHLVEEANPCLPYLALPAGWRFLIAPNYEDVWFDESLLKI